MKDMNAYKTSVSNVHKKPLTELQAKKRR